MEIFWHKEALLQDGWIAEWGGAFLLGAYAIRFNIPEKLPIPQML